jgi:hypothetical protein
MKAVKRLFGVLFFASWLSMFVGAFIYFWFDGSNAAIGDKVFSIALTGAVVFGGAYLILKEQE